MKLMGRVATLWDLVRHFLHRGRFALIPLLVVLLLAGILLLATGGLGYVAPFVYTLF